MRIAILSLGGCGDISSSFQVSYILRQQNIDHTVFCIARDEVWEVINNLFKTYNPIHLPEYLSEENKLFYFLRNGGDPIIDEIKKNYNKVYVIFPDECFSSDFAFPYQEYNYTLQRVKEIRLLTDKWKPENIVYCALNSSTPEYKVGFPEEIVRSIALNNLDCTVYFPVISEWNGKKLDYFRPEVWKDLPNNVIVDENPKFLDSLEILKKSRYCVCLDNGISHIFQHLGGIKLLLDYRMKQCPWITRWRYTLHESIPQDTHPELIGRIVTANLEVPQTTLLPRQYILQLISQYNLTPADWKEILFLKDF